MAKAKYLTKRDSLDFRDKIYQPEWIPVPAERYPEKERINVRDQGEPVSARRLYEMAKRHDHWTGEDYEGSSARGAMKGYHNNGGCPDDNWPYDEGDAGYLSVDRQQRALKYPLGAYYRILLLRPDLHAAINETGAIDVTAETHTGWGDSQLKDGVIPYSSWRRLEGGHDNTAADLSEDRGACACEPAQAAPGWPQRRIELARTSARPVEGTRGAENRKPDSLCAGVYDGSLQGLDPPHCRVGDGQEVVSFLAG